MDTLIQDLRFATRTLVRAPAFAAIAIATFALGIGVNTTIFSAVDAILLRPLPFTKPDALVAVSLDENASASKATLFGLRERLRAFDGVAGWSGWGFTLTGGGTPELLTGARGTANLFDVLGAHAALGRTFLPVDGEPGNGAVAILSDGLWRSRFGASAGVIGSTITLDGAPHTVIGVMPPLFEFPAGTAQLWLPTVMDPGDTNDWTAGYLRIVGRLRAGSTREQATADVRAAMASLRTANAGAFSTGFGDAARVAPLRDELVGPVGRALLVLFGAVGFVLLIACANVANLLLARATGRRREMAIRTALGAGRLRVMRQLVTESTVLALAGGAAGLLLAYWLADAARAAIPGNIPAAARIGVDGVVLGFTLIVSLAAGVLFGLAPAVVATGDIGGSMRDRGGAGDARGQRALSTLMVVEVAVALVLAVGAGLMLRSFRALRSEDPGFDAEAVVAAEVYPAEAAYPTPESRETYWREVLERAAALPGVGAAGAIHLLPFGGSDWNPELVIEGRDLAEGERRPEVGWRVVTPGYFATMGIPVLRGRAFTDEDRDGATPVALVNATLARRMWPGEDPIGRRVRTFFEGRGNWATIVGVVADTKDTSLERAARAQMYRPHAQYPLAGMVLMVRASGDRDAIAREVRGAVWGVDGDVPIASVRGLDDVIGASVARQKLMMTLLVAFGALALVLGAIGIYGVISHAVGQRTRELGVRIALGATRRDVLGLILRDTLRLAAIGLAIGVAASLALTRVLAGQLHEVEPHDPLTMVAVVALLAAVAAAASWLPARRATRIDPAQALQGE